MSTPRSQRPQFTSILSSAWSFYSNTCASIGNDFRVHFLNSSGADLQNLRISRNQRATTIAWPISSNLLAIGWSDGTLSIWNDGDIINNTPLEKSPIMRLAWHSLNSTIVTSSKNGMIAMWTIQNDNSEIANICNIQSQIQVQSLIFSPTEELTAYVISKEGSIFLYQKDMTEIKEIIG